MVETTRARLSWKSRWGLCLGLCLVLDVAAGLAVDRFLGASARTASMINSAGLRTKSAIYRYGFNPMQTADLFWGDLHYPMYTNSLGLRDRSDRSVDVSSDRPRLLIVGDSFTEGLGYSFEQTFAGILQTRLQERGWDVLNAGVSSYSPSVYLAKTKHLLETVGLQIAAVAVFLDISDIQDEGAFVTFDESRSAVGSYKSDLEHHAWMRKLQYGDSESGGSDGTDGSAEASVELSAGRRILRELSYYSASFAFVRELRNCINWRCRAEPEREHRYTDPKKFTASTWAADSIQYEAQYVRSAWTTDEVLFEQYGRRGLEQSDRHLVQLLELLKARGIPMTLVVYPWPHQILRSDLDSKQARYWQDWGARNAVPVLSLFPDFISELPAEEVLTRYFISKDVHWNAEGHLLVAERFYKHFEQQFLTSTAR